MSTVREVIRLYLLVLALVSSAAVSQCVTRDNYGKQMAERYKRVTSDPTP